jgi:hypothetical protein
MEKLVVVCIDDPLIHSKFLDDHVEYVKLVLLVLKNERFYADLKK